MKSGIDEFLDHVDQWQFKLHETLKGMNPTERKLFWSRLHEEARQRGLPVVQLKKRARKPARRGRPTG